MIMVGVSGGVDSSLAAALLAERGEAIAGMFMQNWEESASGACRAEDDRRDAAAVCGLLGIAFHTRNFATEYWDRVFADFLAEYAAGRTPNPDIACNREIKFKTFLEHAQALGATGIATGHYARVDSREGRWRLLRALDSDKDQTYFLHALGQSQLAATEFPLGALRKAEVRTMAAARGLPTARKKDSTGICFIEPGNFRAFLSQQLTLSTGPIEDPEGALVGEHSGAALYTLGQREGLGIGGRRNATGEPWFVVGKDMARNTVIVDQGDSPLLYARRMRVGPVHWIAGAPAPLESLTVKVRYRQVDQPCVLVADGGDSWKAEFAQPQRAVAPGQAAVFYLGDECLGGGPILATDAAYGGLN
ncbi:MAG: tRNA 2-thiouridine(34) synthase MnmA [Lysobacterales bacterium]